MYNHNLRLSSIITTSVVFLTLMALLFSIQLIASTDNEVERVAVPMEGQAGQAVRAVQAVRAPQAVTPGNAVVAGNNVGFSNQSYPFIVNVVSGTTPMTYTWEATDQLTVVHTNINFLSHAQIFNWLSDGLKTITVTASNSNGLVTATHAITINHVAPTTLTLSGPITGAVGTNHTFNANILPITATRPMTYVWEATDQTTISNTNISLLNHSQSFSWNTDGVKTITVTAINKGGIISATHLITVTLRTPTNVGIAGATSGLANNDYLFTATVAPGDTSQPLTYAWQSSDHGSIIRLVNALTDTIPFSWTSPGPKIISVTVSNNGGTVTDTHMITITRVAPTSITISGTTSGQLDTTYPFSGTVSPLSTTQPITYVWQATDQAPITYLSATLTNSQSYQWNSAGEKIITLTASNDEGTVTDTHLITISEPPTKVKISGTISGKTGTDYLFTSTVSPLSTTEPITYAWQATEHTTMIYTGGTLTDVRSYKWNSTGEKLITVTASNNKGTVSDTHLITIQESTITPTEVSITGTIGGQIRTTYAFTATVSPRSTTQPITYVWQATEHEPITRTGRALTDTILFDWSTPGQKVITVTASNHADHTDHRGSVSTFHLITIEERVIPPTLVTMNGLESGQLGMMYPFTATVTPFSTTQPITYTWEATDHLSLTRSSESLSSTQPFSWSIRGPKLITVTAMNQAGVVSDTHLIMVEEIPPTEVMIEGPENGFLGSRYTFVANVGRSNTTIPLTYTWQATGQDPITRTSNALVNHIPFTWSIEGPQSITVTAANHGGMVTNTHTITLVRPLLTLLMSDSPDPVMVGDWLTYTLTATNKADVDATNVVVFDELPLESSFITATAVQGACSEQQKDVTCELGTLMANQSVSMTIVVTATNGRIINRADVSTDNPAINVKTGIIAEDTLVTKPGLGITEINPDFGFNDVPMPLYIEGFGFKEPLSVTLTANMTDTISEALNIRYVDPVLIIANVPAGLEPGFYDLTVATLSDPTDIVTATRVYEAKDASLLDDLRALPEWLAFHPLPMRVGLPDSGISLTVQHLGGQEAVDDVTVAFRLDSITGTLLGETEVITPIAPSAAESTDMLSWQPEEAGEYTIVAIIDPDHQIEESDEENNVITRTITVLPPFDDTEPPVVDEFLIADSRQTTFEQEITLDVTAQDFPEVDGSGIEGIRFIEFEYILGARRWVPVQLSDWVNYNFAQVNYPWRLIPTYGMRYMQAWGVDQNGNISLQPRAEVIDLLPTEQTGEVAEKGVIFYRFYLGQGDTFAATLTPITGDADLHVWDATGGLWSSNKPGQSVETIQFEAPFTATYQIEVHGFSDSNYKLTFGATSNGNERRPRGLARPTERNQPRPLPENAAVPLDEWPEYVEVDPPEMPLYRYYLPLTIR